MQYQGHFTKCPLNSFYHCSAKIFCPKVLFGEKLAIPDISVLAQNNSFVEKLYCRESVVNFTSTAGFENNHRRTADSASCGSKAKSHRSCQPFPQFTYHKHRIWRALTGIRLLSGRSTEPKARSLAKPFLRSLYSTARRFFGGAFCQKNTI